MTETESIILDHLRHIRTAIDGLREDMRDLKRRMTSLESQVATLHGDFAGGGPARLSRFVIARR